jgi:deazaflavin-dependent oxidoreductase (nitroreductase family)
MANLKDVSFKLLSSMHKGLLRVSGGRIGGTGYGMPVVVLTTTGRKSGQPRETVLTTPIEDDDRVVLVASFGGDDRHPAWLLNLREHPDVELEIRGEKRSMTARVATADEKAELWPQVVAKHKGYASYQTKTDRDIPLVILTPRSG